MAKHALGIGVIGIIIIVISIIVAVVFMHSDKSTTLTMRQFIEDYNCGGHCFRSYNPGDSVTVVDKIAIIMTEYEYYGNYGAIRTTFNGTSYNNLLFIWIKTSRNSYSGFTIGAREWSMISDYRNSTHAGDTITVDIQIVEWGSNGKSTEEFIGHIHGNLNLKALDVSVPMPPVWGRR